MCEMFMLYFVYGNVNFIGHEPMHITIWAFTSRVVKNMVSHLLLLVVSMGYGVVRPTLSGLTYKVILLGEI